LRQFADSLEKSKDFKADVAALVKKTFHDHKRIVFNGNNYAPEWVTEARKRGLSNLTTTIEALPEFVSGKSVELFTKHGVFTGNEIYSRYDILLENYCKTLHIEALTMIDMIKGEIIPACIDYQNDLAKLLEKKKACGIYDSSLEGHLLDGIAKLSACLLKKLTALEDAVIESGEEREILAQARFYREKVFAAMSELRLIADELETMVAEKYWPIPSYAQMLYSVI
jgi:glutamine synthetase